MRIKFTGAGEITLRHKTFPAGQPVTMDMENPADVALVAKCLAMPVFEEVRVGRKPKNAQDEA